MLSKINLNGFTTSKGYFLKKIQLSYQTFGLPLGTAPIVLVNHALTGNSNVSGKKGWWKEIIGDEKVINTQKYTIVAFNIPGNGFDGNTIHNYNAIIARDIAKIFLLGLKRLKITKLYALIGGSLGGGIAWEMAVLSPKITEHLIVVATDWKATDWLIGNCQIQEQFLLNSKRPVHDARMHAMLCYRTPKSIKERFKRTKNEALEIFNIESWLLHHGEKLQARFQLSAYKLMNQLLKTIDVTKGRELKDKILGIIKAEIHIVGVDSDLFFTAEENRETQKKLALIHPNVSYYEINSIHGHDAFLIEHNQLEQIIEKIFNPKKERIKILKFGGKSLANGKGIKQVISIIKEKVINKEKIAVVVSARGNATNELEEILEKAVKNKTYRNQLKAFKKYQLEANKNIDFSQEFIILETIFKGVFLLGDYSAKIKDQVLAQGELMSIKMIASILEKDGIKSNATDTRALLKTNDNYGKAQLLNKESKENVQAYFKNNTNGVNIIAGFIASNKKGETTTLGRNGSNYTASLLANYLNVKELQSYTHVNGIYTANPDIVKEAKKIKELSFSEANELANFGASILHSKTIIPLIEKNIPLRILNTFKPKEKGTLIQSKTKTKGIKSLTVQENVALINFKGRGLHGKVGIDSRIFKTLNDFEISVNIVSQGSSETGIGLIINTKKIGAAQIALEREFEKEFKNQDLTKIDIIKDVAVLSLIGIGLESFSKPLKALIKNQITPLLINNTIGGKNISLVIKKQELNKAVNVVHGEVFGISKKINIAIFGIGKIGGTLINQIITSKKKIEKRKGIRLNIIAIANSKQVYLNKNGITSNWKREIETAGITYTVGNIIAYVKNNNLENLIAIDNTANKEFVQKYKQLIENGFDLVSSNKIANTISLKFYKELRKSLFKNRKKYYYETNVGAGLPLINTIQLLHLSGENITRIRGVFSGSLSYLFNKYSEKDISFSKILQETIKKGYTEPDVREDLSGADVARKLLILARELDLENELEEVKIQNLIPKSHQKLTANEFIEKMHELDTIYNTKKEKQKPGYVLRYIGDLYGELSKKDGAKLEVKLETVLKDSPLGQVKGSDSIFEIYTESYGKQPLVIQGAGAGAAVTARGVFGDILRIIEK